MWQETKRIFLESAAQVLHEAARLLPGVLAMVLFIALAVLLASATRVVVRRTCDRLALDRRLRSWGVVSGAADAGVSPTGLLARISFWTVLVVGIFIGVSVVDTPAARAVSMRFLEYAPRLIVAALSLGLAVAIARVVERNVLIGAVNMGVQSARLLALGARWLVLLLGSAIALEEAGVAASVVTVAFGILFGGIVLALALAVGLGAKDVVARSLQRRFPEPGGRASTGTPPPGEAEEPQSRIHHL